jgi:general secretion pathway protein G
VSKVKRREEQGGPCRNRRAAFSLVEILVVMALIGVLAGLVLGIGHFARDKAVRSNTVAEMERIKAGLEEYRLAYGEYPDASAFTEMTETNGGQAFEDLVDYVDRGFVDFRDGWGAPFEYKRVSRFQYRLMSHGPDGPGGREEDDLTNWKGEQ